MINHARIFCNLRSLNNVTVSLASRKPSYAFKHDNRLRSTTQFQAKVKREHASLLLFTKYLTPLPIDLASFSPRYLNVPNYSAQLLQIYVNNSVNLFPIVRSIDYSWSPLLSSIDASIHSAIIRDFLQDVTIAVTAHKSWILLDFTESQRSSTTLHAVCFGQLVDTIARTRYLRLNVESCSCDFTVLSV